MSLAQPTLDDIWKLFQESDRRWQETRKENEKKWQESDRQWQETRKENEKKWQEMREEMRIERREERREIDKIIKEVTTSIGRLGNKLADFIEEMVYPAAVRLFQERGIDVHEVHRNVISNRDGEGIEVDLLVVNNTDIIAVECKSTLGIDDVNEHLERLGKLKRLLPAYSDKQVMGAVSAMIIPENVAQYAYRQGLYVIGQTGNQLVVRNDLNFKAKLW
jgi:hypothetical protein